MTPVFAGWRERSSQVVFRAILISFIGETGAKRALFRLPGQQTKRLIVDAHRLHC
jgi:hypothetical protein